MVNGGNLGGGTVYDSITFDPDLNILYLGVGNAGPYNPAIRSNGKGDNLFLSSIVVLDADSGRYIWHYQTTPGDAWDYTATQNMILAELTINGIRRKVIMQAPKNGGVLTTAGNLVFQGTATGNFMNFDATTGEPLWSYDSQTSIMAAPVSYSINGEQFITVLAGRGGALARSLGSLADRDAVNRSRVLTFKLGGNQSLPQPNDSILDLPDYSEIKLDETTVSEGMKVYNQFCATCHGFGVVGNSVVPDLHYSGFILNSELFNMVLIDGVLEELGMVSFAQELSEKESEWIRQYILFKNQESRRYGDVKRIGR